MINFEEKRILVHTTQADTMKGKNVIVSDEPRVRMLKPRIPEPGVWTVNQCRWLSHRVKLISDMLLEKYARQQQRHVFQTLGWQQAVTIPWFWCGTWAAGMEDDRKVELTRSRTTKGKELWSSIC
jgi:hypothetical protein